jgi:hypothetical protein
MHSPTHPQNTRKNVIPKKCVDQQLPQQWYTTEQQKLAGPVVTFDCWAAGMQTGSVHRLAIHMHIPEQQCVTFLRSDGHGAFLSTLA